MPPPLPTPSTTRAGRRQTRHGTPTRRRPNHNLMEDILDNAEILRLQGEVRTNALLLIEAQKRITELEDNANLPLDPDDDNAEELATARIDITRLNRLNTNLNQQLADAQLTIANQNIDLDLANNAAIDFRQAAVNARELERQVEARDLLLARVELDRLGQHQILQDHRRRKPVGETNPLVLFYPAFLRDDDPEDVACYMAHQYLLFTRSNNKSDVRDRKEFWSFVHTNIGWEVDDRKRKKAVETAGTRAISKFSNTTLHEIRRQLIHLLGVPGSQGFEDNVSGMFGTAPYFDDTNPGPVNIQNKTRHQVWVEGFRTYDIQFEIWKTILRQFEPQFVWDWNHPIFTALTDTALLASRPIMEWLVRVHRVIWADPTRQVSYCKFPESILEFWASTALSSYTRKFGGMGIIAAQMLPRSNPMTGSGNYSLRKGPMDVNNDNDDVDGAAAMIAGWGVHYPQLPE